MQRIFLLLIPAAAFLFQSCGTPASGKNTSMTNDTIPVQVMALDQPDAVQGIAVSGQYTTDDETLLSFKTGGVINAILVREGDRVRKGQLLATLNLTEINTQVGQARLGYEKAQRDYQRALNLYKDSVATLEQLQNAKTALDLTGQQMNAARFDLSYSEIHAPQDGYVLRKLANPGQLITSGATVLQTNGAGGGNWMLRVGLSDREWAAVRLGDKAQMEISALPGQTMPGAVSRKSEGIDPATGTFTADIRLTGSRPVPLATGLFGKGFIFPFRSAARVDTGRSRTWRVPYEALLDGDGSSGFVFVTSDGKTARRIKVVIGGMEKDKVIISDGLQHAGSLIISGSPYLTDNSPISVMHSTQLR
jgi:RND family efflux transporter MFP subunit